MSNSSSSSSGIGFAGLLAILFIALKLTHYITWSWWWVLAPLWIPGSILLAVAAFCLLMAAIAHFVDE
jgi:fatty acid desaturase